MTRETIALWLATDHAVAAGVPEPWTWAAENAAAFLDDADTTAGVAQVELGMAQLDDEDEAIEALAKILVGPPPPAGATMAEQLAYADAVLDAFVER